MPYRHSRWWYWNEPYYVVTRPFVRYYMPMYYPFTVWMGFPLVVYEEVEYVSGPQTVVVTETYYEEQQSDPETEWIEESQSVESDWSSNQTYSVWEDESEETYPWEQTQMNADVSMRRLATEAETPAQMEEAEEVENMGDR